MGRKGDSGAQMPELTTMRGSQEQNKIDTVTE